jgi:hypothetical protein
MGRLFLKWTLRRRRGWNVNPNRWLSAGHPGRYQAYVLLGLADGLALSLAD